MCRRQCLLALVAVYVGLAHSWDIAVGVRNKLIFYTDGTETNTVNFISQKFGALAYDEVQNRMLYVDKQSNYDAICGYGLSSRKNKCFIKITGGSIHSIAFDPVTQILFFTDTSEKSINWISIKPGSINNGKGNLLIKIDDGTPTDMAVDSCRGYIYWINTNMTDSRASIEKVQFNGSGRWIIFKKSGEQFDVLSLVIDPLTRKIYYFDSYFATGYGYVGEYLNHVDFNGQNDRYLYSYYDPLNSPRELTVSKNYLYYVYSGKSYQSVWQFPKNANEDSEPKKIIDKFSAKEPIVIATNYKIEDQTQGLEDCDALSSLRERCDVSVCQNYCFHGNCSLNYEELPTCSCNAGYTGERCQVSVCWGYCLNNGTCSLNEYSEPVCECKQDYVGDRCEVSECLNYCIHGNCSVNDDGLPTCRCNAGYTGERCQVYTCHGYCLNGGDCSLNEEDEPVCQCTGNHGGSRCEAVIDVSFTYPSTLTYSSAERKLTPSDLQSQCLNYCLQGTCSVTDQGIPLCRCNAGYSGERCQVYTCHGYCLNGGDCSLNEQDEPVCQCAGNHGGSRCEAVKDVTFIINNTSTYSAERNLTLADLLSNWRKPRTKITVTVEV